MASHYTLIHNHYDGYAIKAEEADLTTVVQQLRKTSGIKLNDKDVSLERLNGGANNRIRKVKIGNNNQIPISNNTQESFIVKS
jgi:hypothetical protein